MNILKDRLLSLNFITTVLLLGALVFSSYAQTTYIWTGNVNSNFSTAGNWSPFRQIGLVNDILVFESGGNWNVINVNQVTIGQLLIRNNTNITLSPSAGNSKCITIKGNPGVDLSVDAGSSLRILGNDPMLYIYVGAGATASINGILTFEGDAANNLNSNDAMAIRFKNGSAFIQMCPGSVFTSSGTGNAAVFESGSLFKINHSNALSPFGLPAPNSKVLFEDHSKLVISAIYSLQLSGRNFANVDIEPNTNLVINESFTADAAFGSLRVKQNGSLIITNTNSAYIPAINIHGDLTSDGTLGFSEVHNNKIDVKLNGTGQQSISGNGTLNFPANLRGFTVDNDIKLYRDILIRCTYIHMSGIVELNNHNLWTSGRVTNFVPDNGTAGSGNETREESVLNPVIPNEYSISQNYPNPFNPTTKIDYSLPVNSKVQIKIFDITGKEIAVIVNEVQEAGVHTVNFNAGNLSSGVYFYKISAGNFTKTHRMILIK